MPRRSLGASARTVPFVPTGMKQGVSTVPCGRCHRPARAGPSGRDQLELEYSPLAHPFDPHRIAMASP